MEIFDRELGGALVLSRHAIENGWRVILGGKASIFPYLSKFKEMPGVFLLKSIVPGELNIQKKIIANGHRVTSLDVEGLVPSNGEEGVRLRYSEKTINLTEILFFWGNNDYELVKSVYPLISDKSFPFGSPIIDHINLVSQTSTRKNKDKTIFIATSCGYANHISGKNYAQRTTTTAASGNLSKDELNKIKDEILLDEMIFKFWKEFIPELSKKFNEYNIVIRPHPSENKIFWKKYLKKYDNIYFNFEGSIVNFILGSSIFIHFNSTSAVASNILGIPTFMPLPTTKKNLIERLTYVKDLSVNFKNIEEFVEKFEKIGTGDDSEISKMIIEKAVNAYQKEADASKKIIKKFEEFYVFKTTKGKIKKVQISEYMKHRKNRLFYFIQWFIALLLSPFEKFSMFLLPKRIHKELYRIVKLLPPKNSYKYARAKQPSINLSQITSEFERMDFNNYKIKKLSKKLYSIEGKLAK